MAGGSQMGIVSRHDHFGFLVGILLARGSNFDLDCDKLLR